MSAYYKYLIAIIFVGCMYSSYIDLRGVVSSYAHYNDQHDTYLSFRYLPQLEFNINKRFDAEVSGDLYSYSSLDGIDGNIDKTKFSIYRGWVRYNTNALELRVGKQKIVFGPTHILRCLNWFDTIDLKDPTGYTDGVNALRTRYFSNNDISLWSWII